MGICNKFLPYDFCMVYMIGMSLKCKSLVGPLTRYRRDNERGGLAELSRRSEIPASIFSKILNGHQDKINYETWKRLHEAEPAYFPPPFTVEKGIKPGPEFSITAYEAYPSLAVIIQQANEASEQGITEDVFLKIVMNLLHNEIIKKNNKSMP